MRGRVDKIYNMTALKCAKKGIFIYILMTTGFRVSSAQLVRLAEVHKCWLDCQTAGTSAEIAVILQNNTKQPRGMCHGHWLIPVFVRPLVIPQGELCPPALFLSSALMTLYETRTAEMQLKRGPSSHMLFFFWVRSHTPCTAQVCMADKDSLTAKWITVTKDTVTSLKDQEEIAATFCVHAVSRITRCSSKESSANSAAHQCRLHGRAHVSLHNELNVLKSNHWPVICNVHPRIFFLMMLSEVGMWLLILIHPFFP